MSDEIEALKQKIIRLEAKLEEKNDTIERLERKNGELQNDTGSLRNELAQARDLAAMLQFLIRIRAKVEEFETNIGAPYFLDDATYELWVMEKFGENAQELRFGLHYRQWIRILHEGNPNNSSQLENILSQLNSTSFEEFRTRCHRFALTMHQVYKTLSNQMHAELVAQPIFINPKNIDRYISLLPADTVANNNFLLAYTLLILFSQTICHPTS